MSIGLNWLLLTRCVFSLIIFFFSSRRRHTRYIGDWSSDVCSSDLDFRSTEVSDGTEGAFGAVADLGAAEIPAARRLPAQVRSEERRVGKECRARWMP